MGFIPLSCDIFCLDDCACGRLKVQNFIIDDFRVGVFANDGFADPQKIYKVDDLVIRVFVYQLTYVFQQSVTPKFSFIPSAFACDPIPPGSVHFIKDIKFISNHSFNWNGNEFANGEDITDLFRVAGFQIDPSFENLFRNKFNFLGQEPLALRIKDQALQETEFDLNLKLTLSDGREFVFEDLKFWLN